MESTLYPLSHAQQRIWLTEEMYPNTGFANIAFTLRFTDPIKLADLERALNAVLAANDGLRLRIVERDGATLQWVAPHEHVRLEALDFSGDEGDARHHAWASAVAAQPFALLDRPLYWFRALQLPGGVTALYAKIHHALSDGGTFLLFADQISHGLVTASPQEKAPSYLDYLAEEHRYLESAQCVGDRTRWLERFCSLPDEVELPFCSTPGGDGRKGIAARRISLSVPTEIRAAMRAYATARRSSVFKLVSGALAFLLSRLGRTDDVVIGAVNHGRSATTRETMGMFVSTFPLRVNLDSEISFEALTDMVGRDINDTLKNHARYPFDMLMGDLREVHGRAPGDFRKINLVGHPDTELPHVQLEHHFPGSEPAPFTVHINLNNRDRDGVLELSYDHRMDFREEDVQAFHTHLMRVLQQGLREPLSPVGSFDIVSAQERARLLSEFSGPRVDWGEGAIFSSAFEARAAADPDALAVVAGSERLTYRELDRRANGLARSLRAAGVERDGIVAVIARPSLEMVIGVVGILKAGAGYLPIDAKYPRERIEYMLQNSGARVLIAPAGQGIPFAGTCLDISAAPEQDSPPADRPRPSDAAMLIYTSGSTGQPKGVLMEERSLVNICRYYIDHLGVTARDRFSKSAAFGFDASALELFPPLLVGASLWMVDDEVRTSALDLNEFYERHGITISFLTTQLGESFMEFTDNGSLRFLVVGGEKLVRCPQRRYDVLNIYGPTETSIFATDCVVGGDRTRIPIGKPVANTSIRILEPGGQLQPVGAPGEICISGMGVARGYVNQPELTAERFGSDPFAPEERMYRTGDLGRWLPDGSLECLGRIDNQVKIRGYRIEPGEIESRLNQYAGVRQAAVIDCADSNGKKFLCAYLVFDGAAAEPSALKDFLKQDLPDYMIPPFFVTLEKMPVSPNGKIDRRALPAPIVAIDAGAEYVAPQGDDEIALAGLWQEILEVERVGASDDFFALRGHSLKAAILQARIHKTFGVRLRLNSVFEHPTVRQLAAAIGRARQENPVSQPAVPTAMTPALRETDVYALSAAQKRLYVVAQMTGPSTLYNVPVMLKLSGPLDRKRLSSALDTLVARHESLRTSFEMREGLPVARVHPEVKLRKLFRERSDIPLDEILHDFVRPFDLSQAPLMRTRLVEIAGDVHILLLDIHHIVFDGNSLAIFVRELAEVYAGGTPAPLAIQYRDFAARENARAGSPELLKQRDYWLQMFAGEIPILELPTDHPRPSTLDHRGGRVNLQANADLTAGLRQFCALHSVTLHMLLMAAFNVLLARYSGQDDIVSGTPVRGRQDADLEGIVGMFINTLAVRSRPTDDKPFLDFLGEVKTSLLEAQDNQEYQLDALVEDLKLRRDPSRTPLMDVVLVLQNFASTTSRVDSLEMSVEYPPTRMAKFDILVEVTEGNPGYPHPTRGLLAETRVQEPLRGRRPLPSGEGDLEFLWHFRTSLFEPATIERMHGHLLNILSHVVAEPTVRIADIALLSKSEERYLTETVNQSFASYPREATLHALFEAQVARHPDHPAVTFEGRHMSYAELNERANRLARLLRSRGVGRDSIVGILLDRSHAMIVAMLGVLKAGGCYLPISPNYPADRVAYTLENSGTKILLSTPNYDSVPFEGERIDVSQEESFSSYETGNLDNINLPNDLAYIIYTSGSTGRPKGVMIDHHNVVRLMFNDKMQFDFGPDDVWTMFHSFCFDFSVWEMYGALLYGGRLVVVGRDATLSPPDFLALMKREQVTVLNQTPGAFYNLIAEDLKGTDTDLCLRYVVFGGEALKPLMLAAWHAKYPSTRLINMYGITETTVHVTFKEITQREIDLGVSNIGVPIPTLTTYLLDRNRHLVPLGVAGEICVGGEGVARGYLHMEELTAQRFIDNPYRAGERLYRSGDLARRLPNGEMEYFGRMDFQVKIRGFRVELGEIENQLLRHEEIQKASVVAIPDREGSMCVAAYLVMSRDLSISQLREYLSRELPDYMIPSWFVKLEDLPLTSNGKVDRKALPDPMQASHPAGEEFLAPRNETEVTIARAWAKVLGTERIGVRDNFFALGGHSMKAVALAMELQKSFEASVNDLFEFQTVEALALNLRPRQDNLGARLAELKESAAAPPEPEPADMVAARAEYAARNRLFLQRDLSTRTEPRCVLLTGATGFLGAHMLRDLLQDGRSVVAIVRANSDDEARARVHGKLEYYFGAAACEDGLVVLAGDLAKTQLGLPDACWRDLAERVDTIVHTAANVRHYGRYEEFHAANVESTVNLLTLAGSGKAKRFHHVSTMSVGYGEVEGRPRVLFTEDDLDIGQKPKNYYVRTKLEAEKRVVEARAHGVQTSIYRVGNITFESTSGRFQENIEENGFYRQVKAFVNLGAVPDSYDEVDFSFVDQVSRSILRLLPHDALLGQTWHIQSSHRLKLSEVLSAPSLALGVRKLPFGEFLDYLLAQRDRPEFREYVEDVMLHRGWLSDDRATRFDIPQDKTDAVLAALGFAWQLLDVERMKSMVVEGLRQRIDFLGQTRLFAALDRPALERLAASARMEAFAEDSDLLWEGHPNQNFYLLMRGAVETSRHSISGWLGLISILGVGDFLGESHLLNGPNSPVSAQPVLGEAVVLSFEAETLRELLTNNPAFGWTFLQQMNARVRRLERLLVETA